MMRVSFSPSHVYDINDASEFLRLYARMNAHSLHPVLVNERGAKSLLTVRAATECGAGVDPSLSDDEFVQQCALAGLFELSIKH